MIGSVSQPKGGKARCVFFSFFEISALCDGQDDIVVATGVLNCNVALSGASVRVKPELEKSFQLNVARFAARAYGKAESMWGTKKKR